MSDEAIRTALADAASGGHAILGAWTVANEIHIMQDRAGVPVVQRFDRQDGKRLGMSGPVPYDAEFGNAERTAIDLRQHGRHEPGRMPHQCPAWARTIKEHGNDRH